jgi:hypothetical protein
LLCADLNPSAALTPEKKLFFFFTSFVPASLGVTTDDGAATAVVEFRAKRGTLAARAGSFDAASTAADFCACTGLGAT